jgi:hypothetical protein
MTGSNILAETFGKFWITNIHSAGSVEEDRIIGLPGLQIWIIYRRPINSEADLRVWIQEALFQLLKKW